MVMKNIPERLIDLVGPRLANEAYVMVYAKTTHYVGMTKVFVARTPWKKLLPGMEPASKHKIKKKRAHMGEPSETDIERSQRRTKQKIKDIAFCNDVELFATFTFKEDRHDIHRCKTKMANWLSSQQKTHGRFQYLIVPELHKDGALHFHALMYGYRGALKEATNPHTGQPLTHKGKQVYTFPGYWSGFTNVMRIENTAESHAKVANYIRKYITKEMPLFPGKKRYWCSKGMKRPKVTYHTELPVFDADPDRSYLSEYGTTHFFINNQLTATDERAALADVVATEIAEEDAL